MTRKRLGPGWQVGLVAVAVLVASCGGVDPAQFTLESDVEELQVGESTTLSLTVRDSNDLPVPDLAVRLSSDTPGADLGSVEVVTGQDGTARVTLMLSEQVGANRVRAVAGSLSSTLEVRGVAGPPATVTVSADPERVLTGTATTLAVTVTDRFGNQLRDVEVGLNPVSEGIAVDVTAARTDANGVVQAALTTADTPGDNVVEVTAAGLPTQVVTVPGSELASIEVRPAAATVASGQELTFAATGLDPDGNELVGIEAEWTVSGDVGTLAGSGTFAATIVGEGTVMATARELSGTTTVTVTPGPVQSIEVTPAEVSVVSGESVGFLATARDAAGNELPTDEYQWSITPELGTVDEQGELNAIRAGSGTVVATSGGLRGESRVEVTPGPLVRIVVDPGALVIAAGTERQLTASGRDQVNNEIALTPTWSLSRAVATIDDTGLLRGVRAGEAQLVVASGGIAASATVEVVPGPLASMTLSPVNPPDVPAGTSRSFTVVGRDATGNEVAVTPVWSLTPAIGEIDAQGVLTAGRPGEGRLLARSGDISAATTVRVTGGTLTGLEVAPTSAQLVAGESLQLVATGADALGNQTTVEPVWRVSEGAGEVDAAGNFSSTVAGLSRVSATLGGLSVSADVEVSAAALASITLTPPEMEAASGAGRQFMATGKDAHGNDIAVEPAWTVTGGVGTIDSTSGDFTAVTRGQGSVVATVAGVSGVAPVNVVPGPLATIRLGAPTTVRVGRTFQFVWSGLDANGNAVSVTPSWRTTGDVGAIDSAGLFRASAPGSGQVVARVGGITADVPIRVDAGPLATLQISRQPDAAEVASGETVQFSAVGNDEGGNPVEVDLTWEVEGQVGSIDNEGRFTAARAGTGVVRVTSASITAESSVQVVPGELAAIIVAPAEAEVPAATSRVFTATGQDASGNEVSVSPEWSITPGFGRLDSAGRFSAITVGDGLVSATVGRIVGTANVSTIPGRLASFEIVPAEIEITAGEILQLGTAGLDVEGNTTTGFPVQWIVSGGVGTVESVRGVLTAVAVGEGQVIARAGGVRAVATVRVVAGAPSPETSTVSISSAAVPADGETVVEVTATVRDAFRNPISGLAVTLTSNRADDTIVSGGAVTDDRGIVRARLTSRTSGRSMVSVRAGGVTLLASTGPIEFR